MKRFQKLKEVLLDTGKETLTLEIEGVKFFKQFAILKFKGYDNIDDIVKYRGKSLFVTRENAVKLQKDEYFIADLIGLKVIDADTGAEYGELTDVTATGANDVYHVRFADGKVRYVPAIGQVVLKTDLENGVMAIRPLPGLFED